MTEVPFEVLMADLCILCGGLVTVPWCKVLTEILRWHTEPPTLKKAVILFVGIFIPLGVFYLLALIGYPEAFSWRPT